MCSIGEILASKGEAPLTKMNEGVNVRHSTYVVVSKMAYLIGIEKNIFVNNAPEDTNAIYSAFAADKNTRVIRNLCLLRTAIMKNYSRILSSMKYEMKNLYTLPEYVPQNILNSLSNDGISIFKANCTNPLTYIVEINNQICNRINNVKHHFPVWLNWEYIRKLFIMPNGLDMKGAEKSMVVYFQNRARYPYQNYINWPFVEKDMGNILYNDRRFVSILYEAYGDTFQDLSNVTSADEGTRNSIYDFLADSDRTVVVVDCENADPYKLHAALNDLNREALLGKIAKIILFDDVHTSTAWKILEDFTDIPVEYMLVERIKDNKSLVDMRLAMGTSREFYQNNVDSFILVSSDSDYWGMISAMPEARFYVMVESENCSPTLKKALDDAGISYCYINDFCTGYSDNIKVAAILGEMRRELDKAFSINITEMFENACRVTRAEMGAAERTQFFNKYIKNMKLTISTDGDVKIEFSN